MRNGELCVAHVAALGDREALDGLAHTTQVIATLGVGQVLLALDDGRGVNGSRCAPVAAEVRLLHWARLSVVGKVRALQSELAKLVHETPLYAVHLHGAGPCLVGALALKGGAVQARVLYSPHRRHFGSAWATPLIGRLLRSQLAALRYAPLAASLTEAEALSKLLNRSAEVVPHPVGDAFFKVPRREDARPSVLAEGVHGGAVDLATRLSILLNVRAPRVRFLWLGIAEGKARARLEAASVEVLGAEDDGQRAQLLSRACAFLHMARADHPAIAVAQAMAAGVPCLVSDIPAHRALIHHGETGLVCTSGRDFLEKLILLLRDPHERRRLGEAAREEAARRFTLRHYHDALLRAYGFGATQREQTCKPFES